MSAPERERVVQATLADMADVKRLRLDPLKERIREISLDVLRVLHEEFQGVSLTLSQKQEVADRIHVLLDEYGLRPACLSCNEPAILRANSGLENGNFLFDHYVPDPKGSGKKVRTNHGCYTELPLITSVVDAPRRGRLNGVKTQSV
jgi:hypothetical protein